MAYLDEGISVFHVHDFNLQIRVGLRKFVGCTYDGRDMMPTIQEFFQNGASYKSACTNQCYMFHDLFFFRVYTVCSVDAAKFVLYSRVYK